MRNYNYNNYNSFIILYLLAFSGEKVIVSRTFITSCESTRLSKAHDLEIVQIVGKNSVDSHLPDVKGTCIQLSYDVTQFSQVRIIWESLQMESNYCLSFFVCHGLKFVSLSSVNIMKKNLKGKSLKKQPVAGRITELHRDRLLFFIVFWSTDYKQ